MSTTATRRRRSGEVPDVQPGEPGDTARVHCECLHGEGPFGPILCQAPATRRATVICRAEDCDDPVETYVLCTECADDWVSSAAQNPSAPEVRVEPL